MKKIALLLSLSCVVLLYACSKDDGPDIKLVEVPDVQISCNGVPAVSMNNADIVLSGAGCSEAGLRNAVAQGGKILCDCGGATINITSEIQIIKDVVIDGGNVILDGGGSTRIFHKIPGPDVDFTLQNITLRNGRSEGSGPIYLRSGALITARSYDADMAMDGSLICINVTFEDSRTASLTESDVAGGAVYLFGVPEAVFSECVFNNNRSSNGGAIGGIGSPLTIMNSVFSNNFAMGDNGLAGFGGAIYLDGTYSGTAGLGVSPDYTVCGTQFINNQAVRFGGASASVITRNSSALISFDKCTFSQNRAGINGGYYSGGAIYHVDDLDEAVGTGDNSFKLTNSTLMNNEAHFQGGGLWIICKQGVIANSTFYRNAALEPQSSLGGAMAFAESNGYGGNYLVVNSTFAENTTELFSGASYVAAPNFVSFHGNIFYANRGGQNYPGQGHQLNGDPGSYSANGNLNIYYPVVIPNGNPDELILISSLNEDPLLLPPADNGGPTFTMALQPGSPAIDAGDAALATAADQRGIVRDGKPDLGAYEVK